MTLQTRLLRIEQIQADHEQQLGGDRLARIENKLDALLAALAEDEPAGEDQPAAMDLDSKLPPLAPRNPGSL